MRYLLSYGLHSIIQTNIFQLLPEKKSEKKNKFDVALRGKGKSNEFPRSIWPIVAIARGSVIILYDSASALSRMVSVFCVDFLGVFLIRISCWAACM